MLSHRAGDAGRVLENVVFNELARRWRGVFVGKCGAGEIDFVARDGGETAYFQVAETLRGPGILERELAPLRTVDDNFPKTVITLDPIPRSTENGIVCMNAIDFLLSRCPLLGNAGFQHATRFLPTFARPSRPNGGARGQSQRPQSAQRDTGGERERKDSLAMTTIPDSLWRQLGQLAQ